MNRILVRWDRESSRSGTTSSRINSEGIEALIHIIWGETPALGALFARLASHCAVWIDALKPALDTIRTTDLWSGFAHGGYPVT